MTGLIAINWLGEAGGLEMAGKRIIYSFVLRYKGTELVNNLSALLFLDGVYQAWNSILYPFKLAPWGICFIKKKKKSKHFYLPMRRGISEKWEECRIVPLPLITLDFFQNIKSLKV